jgi:hypothetical protein
MKKPLLLFFIAFSFHSFAQKIKLTEGNLSALKGQKSINFEFTYDGIRVGKYANEKEYIEKRKTDYNAKEPGKGDKWEKDWVGDRKGRFEPRFVESFTSAGMSQKQDAQYTLIFNTAFIEPGFNVGVARKNAYIDGVALLVATADKSKILAKLTVDNAPGRMYGGDFDTGLRIQESYATAGKGLGRFVAKTWANKFQGT